jgi:hypothetical protein
MPPGIRIDDRGTPCTRRVENYLSNSTDMQDGWRGISPSLRMLLTRYFLLLRTHAAYTRAGLESPAKARLQALPLLDQTIAGCVVSHLEACPRGFLMRSNGIPGAVGSSSIRKE